MQESKRFTMICGHYGCGKTNLSLNLAIGRAAAGREVTLVDLDLVNPYFRSSDYTPLLRERGVRMIAPAYAGTTMDVPALLPEINSIFERAGDVIVDAGGDDAGVTALGSFSAKISALDYDLLYVVNCYRPLSANPAAAIELLREIEAACRLTATGVINNSHLMGETDADTIRRSLPYAAEIADTLGLPLRFTTAPAPLAESLDIPDLYPVTIYVRTPW
jgi:hypothetical protein